MHACTHARAHTHTVSHALLSVCGKRPSELFLALTASRAPSSLPLSPLSSLFSPSLSHSQGCQAALTMNQSCVRLFDCSWGSAAEGVRGYSFLPPPPCTFFFLFPYVLSLINAASFSRDLLGFSGSFSLQQTDQFCGVASTRQEHTRSKRSTVSAVVQFNSVR